MAIFREFLPWRPWRDKQLSDRLPWRAVALPGVIMHKQSHALQRSYAFRGPDLDSYTDDIQGSLMLQANQVFMRLAGPWTIHGEGRRTKVRFLPEEHYEHAAAYLMARDYHRQLINDRESYANEYYITLTWTPPRQLGKLIERLAVTPGT